jgi:F0F1-type ATP synthase assembly protein I
VTERKKPDRFFVEAARYTSIAMTLPAGVLAGYAIGYGLDRWLGTTYLKIVFLLIGIASGFIQLIRELMRDTKSK